MTTTFLSQPSNEDIERASAEALVDVNTRPQDVAKCRRGVRDFVHRPTRALDIFVVTKAASNILDLVRSFSNEAIEVFLRDYLDKTGLALAIISSKMKCLEERYPLREYYIDKETGDPTLVTGDGRPLKQLSVAAPRVGYNPQYATKLAEAGKIVTLKLGREHWVDESALEAYRRTTKDLGGRPPKSPA